MPVAESLGEGVPDPVVAPLLDRGAVRHLQVQPADGVRPHRVQGETIRVSRIDQFVGGRRDIGQDAQPRMRVHALPRLCGRGGNG